MSAGNAPSAAGVVTYRGRSLEEVLPKIREELGPDAVIERQRTGLVGGVGGFFQRAMVEVDARPALEGETATIDVLAEEDDEAVLRAATAPPVDEGTTAEARQRIMRQASPFADALADAEADLPPEPEPEPEREPEPDVWSAWTAPLEEEQPPPASAPAPSAEAPVAEPEPDPAPPRTAPRPAAPAAARAAAAYRQEPDEAAGSLAAEAAAPASAPQPARPARVTARRAAPDAAAIEAALAATGLTPALASAVVAEAVTHARPFARRGEDLRDQVRATLARRIPVQSGFGGSGRSIALVGPAGAGKTRAAGGIATAYAAGSSLQVLCLSLRPRHVGTALPELLAPYGIAALPVADGAAARRQVEGHEGEAIVVVDTPAVSPRDADGIAALAGDLDAAGVGETHVVLPATLAAPVARETLRAFAPLRPAAVLVTHADETDHLGPLVDLAIAESCPLSYVASGPEADSDLVPADRGALARRLLP